MDAVFYFTFYTDNNEIRDDDTEECTIRHLGFYINNIRKPWSQLEEDLADVASELELEYGVHDWGSSPSGVNAIGYHSYEVEEERCDELMEVWRQAFLEHAPDCVVSDVVEVPNMDDMNDAEILQFTQNAHEQVLAEQQRGILTAHVATSASSAASKKM